MKSNEWFKAKNNPPMSGDGAPDFEAEIGTRYQNTATGIYYINEDGTSTGWEVIGDQTAPA